MAVLPTHATAVWLQGKNDPARLKDNSCPKWSVPQELIEWQPAYAQRGGWLWALIGGTGAPYSQSACLLVHVSLPEQPCWPSLLRRARSFLVAKLPAMDGCCRAGAKGISEGFWQADWKHTQSTKCVHLLRRLLEVGAAVLPSSGRQPSSKAIVYTQVRRQEEPLCSLFPWALCGCIRLACPRRPSG